MEQQLLTAQDLGNITGVLSDVLGRFRFDRGVIILESAETTDRATRHRLLAEFFARYSVVNAKACAAWSPNPERTCHPTTASEIIDAIPRIPDPNAARDQIFNLLHWTQGPGQTPHAPPPMRLTLITLISVFVQSAINPEKTDHYLRTAS